jgi:hypothetical protein
MGYRKLFKIIVTIADIHIGCRGLTPEEYKYQLKHGVINKLKEMPFIDGVVILGDTLHEKLPLNSEYANIFFWFIAQLIKVCKDKNAFVRVIKGTKSHDVEQLDNISFYEEELDFKIFNTLTVEEIDGHMYGFIPEEYVSDMSHYDPILKAEDNYFDMLFGHGLIESCKLMHQDSENHNTKAPLFYVSELSRVCVGPISFGHIHTPMVVKNKFYYVGSVLRLCHGEEEDKGYNIIVYLKKEGLYRVESIINEYTLNFNTMKLSSDFIEKHTVDDVIYHVNEFMAKHKTHKLSLKVKCVDRKETSVKINLLKRYYAQHIYIRTSFKIMSEKAYEKEIEVEKNREVKPYLQKGLSLVDQIRIWALEKRNHNLADSDIERFIK